MKTLAVVFAGQAGQVSREVDIEVGSTARSVLLALDLDPGQFLLYPHGAQEPFAESELIYDLIDDGGKLRAAPLADVGLLLIRFLTRGAPQR